MNVLQGILHLLWGLKSCNSEWFIVTVGKKHEDSITSFVTLGWIGFRISWRRWLSIYQGSTSWEFFSLYINIHSLNHLFICSISAVCLFKGQVLWKRLEISVHRLLCHQRTPEILKRASYILQNECTGSLAY